MKTFPPIDRGNVALIKAIPKDVNGNPVTPDSIGGFIQYETLEQDRHEISVSLTLSSGVWTTTWDTSGPDIAAGDVYVSLRAVNPPAASDFTFLLQANPANPSNPP